MTFAQDQRLERAMLISLAAHLILTAGLMVKIYTPSAPRAMPLPPIRAYTVRLGPPAPPAAAPVVEEAPAPPPKGVSVEKKVEPPPVKKAPEKRKEEPKKTVKETKPQAAPVKAAAPASGAQTQAAPAGNAVPGLTMGASGGVSGVETGDFAHAWYLEAVQRRIAESWIKPSTLGVAADATLYFRIQRDGRVTDVEVRQSSGDTTYDRAAMRAVMGTSPLPPLPRGFTRDYLGVYFTFLREEAR